MRAAFEQNRRAAIIGAGVLGLVVVVVAFKVLTGGGSPPPVFTPTTTTTGVGTGAPGAASPTTTAPGGGVAVYTSKDPFTPLYNPSTAASSGSTSGSPAGSTSGSTSAPGSATPGTGSSGSSGTGSTTAGGGAAGAGAAPGGSTSPTSGQEVQVLDIYASGPTTEVSIQVDGAEYQVDTGQNFAGNYYVVDLSVSTQCGDFTHGGAPFHACRGQKVLK